MPAAPKRAKVLSPQWKPDTPAYFANEFELVRGETNSPENCLLVCKHCHIAIQATMTVLTFLLHLRTCNARAKAYRPL